MMDGEFHRVRRIGLVEDDGQVALLGDIAGGQRAGSGRTPDPPRAAPCSCRRPSAPDRGTRRPSCRPAPRRIVEPHVVADLAVHLEREIPHQQQAALLDERHDRRGRHGRVGREQQIDLVDVDQLGVDRRRLRCARLVVIDDQFDLAAEQAALGIDIVAPDFDAEQRSLAAAGEAAGLRHRHADLDRRLLRQGALSPARPPQRPSRRREMSCVSLISPHFVVVISHFGSAGSPPGRCE